MNRPEGFSPTCLETNAGLIALAYLASGILTLAASGELFFLAFIIAGLMMELAALPKRSA